MDLTAELGRLAELHAAGSLTDAEFAAAKERILGLAGDGEPAPASATPLPRPDVAQGPPDRRSAPGRRRALMVGAGLVLVLVVAGVAVAVHGRGGADSGGRGDAPAAASADPDAMYAADNEAQFAQDSHDCSELGRWYELNPYDSNADIAHQYWEVCQQVPPPVKNFELAPFDEENMFAAMLVEQFPQGSADSAGQLVPLGRQVCEYGDLDSPRYEVQNAVKKGGVSDADATGLITVAVTTLCPQHQDLLNQDTEAPPPQDRGALAEQLDAALRQQFGDAYVSVGPAKLAQVARTTCQGLEQGYGSDVATLWVEEFRSMNFAKMGRAAGMAVSTFCPEDVSLIAP